MVILQHIVTVTNQTRFKGIETLLYLLLFLWFLHRYKPDPIQGDWDLSKFIFSPFLNILLQTRPDSRGLRRHRELLFNFYISYKPDPIQGDWDVEIISQPTIGLRRYKPDPIQGDWDYCQKFFQHNLYLLQTRPDSRGLRLDHLY